MEDRLYQLTLIHQGLSGVTTAPVKKSSIMMAMGGGVLGAIRTNDQSRADTSVHSTVLSAPPHWTLHASVQCGGWVSYPHGLMQSIECDYALHLTLISLKSLSVDCISTLANSDPK